MSRTKWFQEFPGSPLNGDLSVLSDDNKETYVSLFRSEYSGPVLMTSWTFPEDHKKSGASDVKVSLIGNGIQCQMNFGQCDAFPLLVYAINDINVPRFDRCNRCLL